MAQNRYYRGPVSDHFDGTRFFNPGQPSTDRSLKQIWTWRTERVAPSWPKRVAGGTPAKPEARQDRLTITMVGHATVLIQVSGLNILVDPIWSERAGPFQWIGPKRVNAPGVAFRDLPPIDAVLLTHNHYDHLDKDTLRRLEADHRPRLITPLGNDKLIGAILPADRVHVGDWGSSVKLNAQSTVHIVPAHHWSARGPGDRRMALWCGFVIEAPAGLIYNVGDTGYGDGKIFRDIHERFRSPDVAIIPIGAYEPKWFMHDQHVIPEEAVSIMQDCGAAQGLGVHWGTFMLGDEDYEAPRQALAESLNRARMPPDRFLAFAPGNVWVSSQNFSSVRPSG